MGVKDLNVRDRYAAEARDKHVTKLNNVLYIIVVLVKVKTSKYLSKQTKFETKLEVKKKKIHNSYVSFDIVTFAIYGKNNGNMIVGETSEFFQFPKCDICISTARCICTIHIFTYKSIKVAIRTEFINMTVLLSM